MVGRARLGLILSAGALWLSVSMKHSLAQEDESDNRLTTTDSSAAHFSLPLDNFCSRSFSTARITTKAMAEPTTEAVDEMKKPFMPYAKPESETNVVCPIHGGKQTMTGRV